MTIFQVTAGATSTGMALLGGDFLYVSAGGTAIFTQISGGGSEVVLASGIASDTLVGNGGTETVSSGGTAISTTVSAGGTEYVYSSATASDAMVIGADATQLVYAGGTAISTALTDGSVLDVYDGGLTSSTTLIDATENVYASGTADYMQLSSGGVGNVYAGGQSNDALVNSGGIEYVHASGIASATTVRTQATEFLYPGASAHVTVLVGGGTQIIYPDAAAFFTTVRSGGLLVLLPGGSLTDSFAQRGGEIISTGVVLYRPESAATPLGASATDVAVSSGAIEYVISGGTTSFTTVSSGGTENVFADGVAVSTTVNSGGTEFVYSGADPNGTTVNVGGAIDVSYLSYTRGGSTSVTTGDLLIVSVGGQTYTQQLAGSYADEHFQLAQDGGSGTSIIAAADAACFRGGTRILTERGEVAVEALRVGDRVPTVLGGSSAPIIWIGRREVDCIRHPRPRNVWPVRVAAGAFGPGRPGRDLFLSPDHAVYVNDVLIPVRYLINGGTIAQVPMDEVTYYHVELPEHDVLLAEGLPAETFLDLRDGSNYANRRGPARLYPDFSPRMWEAFGCAPLIVTGPEVEAARALVASYAWDRLAA